MYKFDNRKQVFCPVCKNDVFGGIGSHKCDNCGTVFTVDSVEIEDYINKL